MRRAIGLAWGISLALLAPTAVALDFSGSTGGMGTVVQGHTIFVAFDQAQPTVKAWDLAINIHVVTYGPNVLWFNNRYKTFFANSFSPCFGIVFATNQQGDPRGLANMLYADHIGSRASYQESYLVVLPDDSFSSSGGVPTGNEFVTDLYSAEGAMFWVGSVFNLQTPEPRNDPGGCPPETTTIQGTTGSFQIPYLADLFGKFSGGGSAVSYGSGGKNASDNTTTGNSHPYGTNGPGPQHSHSTSTLYVTYLPPNDPTMGPAFVYPPPHRTFAIDCVHGTLCTPSLVGTYPASG